MTPISEISEALNLLNTLVDRGEERLARWNKAEFSIGTRGPLWALVDGAMAVLGDYVENPSPEFPNTSAMAVGAKYRERDRQTIIQANAYRPAMVELGWWK